MRPEADITNAIELHADTVLRVCALYFANGPDRDDAFQEAFIKYAQHDEAFNDEEHRKAWLIRVATNTCKDLLKRAESKTVLTDRIDEGANPDWRNAPSETPGDAAEQLAAALQQLEDKYRIVLFLKYYEGYAAREIGTMLRIPENTVYTNLARGREKLKEVLTHGC